MSDPLRLAASLIGVRDGGDRPEVLLIERTLEHRFLPGYVTFPGGAVDASDELLADRWFGDPGEAGRAAAVRELAEEVRLAVTDRSVLRSDPGRPLAAVHDRPPSVAQLPEIARWVAPERVPVRFDARFFAALMDDEAAAPSPDGHEAAAAWWASPSEVLRRWAEGELLLYWPTHFTLRALARCRDAPEVLHLRIVTREPDERDLARLPRSVFFQE